MKQRKQNVPNLICKTTKQVVVVLQYNVLLYYKELFS